MTDDWAAAGQTGPLASFSFWLTRRQAGPALGRLALAFGAGWVLVFGFAPYGFWPVIFFSLPLLAVLLDRAPSRLAAFGIGWAGFLGQFAPGMWWISTSFLQQDQVPAALAPWATLALTAGLAIYGGLAFLAARMVWTRHWSRLIVFALAWMAAEWLRGHLFTGFPWNLPASVWISHDLTLQPLAATGAYGWSLLTLLLAASPLALIETRGWGRLGPGLVLIAPALLLLGWGAARLQADPGMVPGVSLRLVQANIAQKDKWNRQLWPDHFARYMAMSEGDNAGRTLIIWPETAVPFDLDRQVSRRVLLSRLLDVDDVLITGAVRGESSDGLVIDQLYNSLYAIAPDGAVASRYDKAHLVPFGEYTPFRPVMETLGLGKLTAGNIDFSAGSGAATLDISGLAGFSPLICYEVIFPGRVVAEGPRPGWLLTITNDSWFGLSAGPYQHFAQARMRAVEEGLPLVRVAVTGISGVVDALGRVIRKSDLEQQVTVTAPLPRALEKAPPFARWGNLIFFAIFGIFLGLATVFRLRLN